MRACARACVHACVCVCVRACVVFRVHLSIMQPTEIGAHPRRRRCCTQQLSVARRQLHSIFIVVNTDSPHPHLSRPSPISTLTHLLCRHADAGMDGRKEKTSRACAQVEHTHTAGGIIALRPEPRRCRSARSLSPPPTTTHATRTVVPPALIPQVREQLPGPLYYSLSRTSARNEDLIIRLEGQPAKRNLAHAPALATRNTATRLSLSLPLALPLRTPAVALEQGLEFVRRLPAEAHRAACSAQTNLTQPLT